ncbi:MAG: bifunctional folylpolyglutamate synthase/dihydrofolate synthase, partial [Clostridiales bacterium]|nr:bifunctional folylpolyglutamate synthase/dihydrofolate synthase [Clostridiales bacterium]
KIVMLGEHQLANASLALETALILQDLGFPITEKSIYAGLEKTLWLGRFSLGNKEPLVIVDGAHNEDAAGKLAAAVSFYFTNKKIIYIMGVLKDKEYEKIAGLTVHLANQVITITPPNNPRGLHAYELAKIVKEYNENVTAADSLAEALEMSYLLADEETVIIVFGSLSYLGEMIAIIKSGKIDWRDLHGKSRKNRTGSQTDVRGNRRRP